MKTPANNRIDWARTPGKSFGHWQSPEGWTAEYQSSYGGYVCYKIRDPKGKYVRSGGIVGLDGKNVGQTG